MLLSNLIIQPGINGRFKKKLDPVCCDETKFRGHGFMLLVEDPVDHGCQPEIWLGSWSSKINKYCVLAAASGFLAVAVVTSVSAADLASQPVITPASPPAYDFWTSPYLFGDWGGERTRLHNQGIDFQLGYVGETVYNYTGGTKSQLTNAGQFVIGNTLDLQKIWGIQGGTFQTTITERNGKNNAGDTNSGALQLTNEVYGRGDIFRLTQFWYDQKFDPLGIDVKIGRVLVAEDFFTFSCDFINLTLCGGAPGNIAGNYILNFPTSQWGGRLKDTIPGLGYLEIGLYDINPKYLDLNPGYALAPTFPSGSTGAMVPVEVGWLPTFGKLAGSYAIGAWYDTSAANDSVTSVNGQPTNISGLAPLRDNGRYGGYLTFKQQFTADPTGANPKHGLFGFFNATFLDERTSTIDRQIAGGILYHGLFDFRPNDDLGVGMGTSHINARIAAAQAAANNLGIGPGYVQTGELVTEAWYGLQLTGSINLKGDFQYIHNPGGYNNYGYYKDIWLSGLRVTVAF
jgi:porin